MAAPCSVCERVCVFLCRVFCVPALSVDPEDLQVVVRCWRKLEGGSRIVAGVAASPRESDRSTGFRVDSDSEALPKSALHNLVSERRYTDGQKVLGTQDKRRSIQTCSRVQSGHRNFAESGTVHIPHRAVCNERRVLYGRHVRKCKIVWRSSGQNGAGFEEDASVWATAPPVDVQAAHLQIVKTGQRTRRRGDESSCSIDVEIELSKAYSRGTQMAKAQHQKRSGVAALAAEVTLKFVTAVMLF